MPVRLFMYGGAKSKSDNSAFKFAMKNVRKDYGKESGMVYQELFISNGAHQIMQAINQQSNGSVQSIDFFSHGSEWGTFWSMGASETTNISNPKQSNIYRGAFSQIYDVLDREIVDKKDQYSIFDLNFAKFTNGCKIEFHGCSTAKDTINLCEALSEALYDNGKKRAVVIGHVTPANPLIYGNNTTLQQQDYRHGTRRIYHNGKILQTTTTQGRISATTINALLKTAGV